MSRNDKALKHGEHFTFLVSEEKLAQPTFSVPSLYSLGNH